MASTTRGINPDLLISPEFSRHTLAGLEGTVTGSTLKYYIHTDEGKITLDDGSRALSVGHSDEDIAFINNIFLRLDPLIELDFERQENWDGTLLDIYSLSEFSQWDNDIVGQVVDQGSHENSYWDVLWRDTDGEPSLSSFDASTIIHEIGHALGLSHPNEDPYNENWNTSDTIMSYNEGDNGWDTWFSLADINALQLIWGPESGEQLFLAGSSAMQGDKYVGSNLADEITGSNGSDSIRAKDGSDYVYARGGDDVINTGKGEDFTWGGAGADLFKISLRQFKGGKSIDYIMDFQPGLDKIAIQGFKRGLAIESYQDSSYISMGEKIVAWIDGVSNSLIGWSSPYEVM